MPWATVGSLSVSCRWPAGILSVISGCHYGSRPLTQASVKSVGQAWIIDHSPIWRVRFPLPRNYLYCKINTMFYEKTPQHKPTTVYFYFTKFYIPNCPIKWHWKATLGFVNEHNIIWLPPSGNYIMHILAKSYNVVSQATITCLVLILIILNLFYFGG